MVYRTGLQRPLQSYNKGRRTTRAGRASLLLKFHIHVLLVSTGHDEAQLREVKMYGNVWGDVTEPIRSYRLTNLLQCTLASMPCSL